MRVNVNDHAMVRLTDSGKKILAQYWNRDQIPEWYSRSQSDGWYRFQIHELFHIFGSTMHIGNMNPPFETTFEIEIAGIGGN
jgi:hypothetical protein